MKTRTPSFHSYELRDAQGRPVDLSANTVARNWLKAVADFANYMMEGHDRCRQIEFELDYFWRTNEWYRYYAKHPKSTFQDYTASVGYSRFRIVRKGNCKAVNYEVAVHAFLEAFHSVSIDGGPYSIVEFAAETAE